MQRAMLVTRVGAVACAFPVEDVVETMRPLPVVPLVRPADAEAVDGLAMIRGAPVPVVDLRRLLGAPIGPAGRFVVVRAAARQIALVVDSVIDVTRIERDIAAGLPPLLRDGNRDAVSALGARDGELIVVLDAARVLPEASWRAIEAGGAGSVTG